MPEDKRDQIRALRAKAASTQFAPEAAEARRLADKLEAKYHPEGVSPRAAPGRTRFRPGPSREDMARQQREAAQRMADAHRRAQDEMIRRRANYVRQQLREQETLRTLQELIDDMSATTEQTGARMGDGIGAAAADVAERLRVMGFQMHGGSGWPTATTTSGGRTTYIRVEYR